MWWTLALAATASAVETRFVQGSTLNLRAEPTPEGAVREVLEINREVVVLSVEGTFAKVRADGEEGWVAAEFLAPEPLTVEAALARAEHAPEPEERLSWLQRAAAIRPDDAVLAELENAYRDVGDTAAMQRVSRERRWPRSLILVATDGVPSIELSQGEAPTPSGEPDVVPPATLERRFRMPGNAVGWLLPDRGAAVRAQIAGARKEALGGCDTGWATVAYVAAGLPFGREGLVFTRGDPPAGWTDPTPEPPVPRETAVAAGEARLERIEAAGDETVEWTVPMPDGWFVRVGRGSSPGLPDLSTWQTVDLHVTATGVTELRAHEVTSSYWGPPEPVAIRDLDGDGALDLVERTGCGRTVTSLAGDPLASTAGRCCRFQEDR